MNTLLKPELDTPLKLMEEVLGAQGRLADEFPLVFRRGFPGRVVDLGSSDQSHSACAVLPREFLAADRRFQVGLIGSVATHPDQRRRGLAGRVLESAEDWLRAEGALLSLLWADDPRFYLPRGYRPVGCEIDVLVSTEDARRLPASEQVRHAEPEDAEAVWRLYRGHSYRTERTLQEMEALLQCPDMSILVIGQPGDLRAYACLGRGRDLHGVVHEWAGEPAAVLALIRAHAERSSSEGVVVIAPDSPELVLTGLQNCGASLHRGYLGLAKLLDLEAAATRLEEWGGGRASVQPAGQGTKSRSVAWSGPAGSTVLEASELLDVLFAPRANSPVLASAREATGLAAPALPLRLFCWGLDSI